LGELLTGKNAGETMSERRALGLAAWYSGVRYLAESLAYLPVRALRGEDDYRTLPLWISKPESDPYGRPLMTWGRLVELWVVSLIHNGNGYGFKLRDPVGRVTGMRYLHPKRISNVAVEDGEKVFTVDVDGKGDKRKYSARDIFHLVGLSTNGVTGISAVEYHARNLGIATSADEFAGTYFDRGTLITSYIQLKEQTRKPIEELRAEFEEFYSGIENANRGAVLSSAAEYKTVSLNARDAQVLEARQWSVLEIARILRVPPHKLYDLSRATFSNIEQQSIESVQDGPRVWAERFEEQISADPDLIAATTKIQFQLDALLRGDTAAEVSAIHSGIQDGYLSLADARQRRGLRPAPGMDVVYRPANVHTVDVATGEVLIPAGAPDTPGDVSDTSDDDAPSGPGTSDPAPSDRSNGHSSDLIEAIEDFQIPEPEHV
jgi:HK97 family phage portal protein